MDQENETNYLSAKVIGAVATIIVSIFLMAIAGWADSVWTKVAQVDGRTRDLDKRVTTVDSQMGYISRGVDAIHTDVRQMGLELRKIRENQVRIESSIKRDGK